MSQNEQYLQINLRDSHKVLDQLSAYTNHNHIPSEHCAHPLFPLGFQLFPNLLRLH